MGILSNQTDFNIVRKVVLAEGWLIGWLVGYGRCPFIYLILDYDFMQLLKNVLNKWP